MKVLPHTETKPPTTPAEPQLPQTGPREAAPVGLVGLVLVGLGITAVATTRRRRPEPVPVRKR